MSERMYYSREAEQRAFRQQMIMVLLVAVISVTAGVIAALALAPRKGEESRRIVGEQLNELADNVKERVFDARR